MSTPSGTRYREGSLLYIEANREPLVPGPPGHWMILNVAVQLTPNLLLIRKCKLYHVTTAFGP